MKKCLVITFLMLFTLTGNILADECIGEECFIGMNITVESNRSIPVYITYTATKSLSPDIGLPTIKDNIVNMIGNFFALTPTFGAILGISVLIVGIFIIINYMYKFKQRQEPVNFSG